MMGETDQTLAALVADPWFPFEGDVRLKPRQDLVLPEPAREGEDGADCSSCSRSDDSYVWTNGSWRLTGYSGTPLPGVVLLQTRIHVDTYSDLPDDLLAELGPLTARVERALLSLEGVGRVHLARWGDGGAHFHQWFLPRPAGDLQLRGSMLPMWLDLLPPLPAGDVAAVLDRVGAAMRAGD